MAHPSALLRARFARCYMQHVIGLREKWLSCAVISVLERVESCSVVCPWSAYSEGARQDFCALRRAESSRTHGALTVAYLPGGWPANVAVDVSHVWPPILFSAAALVRDGALEHLKCGEVCLQRSPMGRGRRGPLAQCDSGATSSSAARDAVDELRDWRSPAPSETRLHGTTRRRLTQRPRQRMARWTAGRALLRRLSCFQWHQQGPQHPSVAVGRWHVCRAPRSRREVRGLRLHRRPPPPRSAASLCKALGLLRGLCVHRGSVIRSAWLRK